jgi:hypothetical protein
LSVSVKKGSPELPMGSNSPHGMDTWGSGAFFDVRFVRPRVPQLYRLYPPKTGHGLSRKSSCLIDSIEENNGSGSATPRKRT